MSRGDLHMQHVRNPMRQLIISFGTVAALCLLAGVAGIVIGGDQGLFAAIVGFAFGVILAPIVLYMWVLGNRQVKEAEALRSGEGLLARWTFGPGEWQQFTAAEYGRGLRKSLINALIGFGAGGVGVAGGMDFTADGILYGLLAGAGLGAFLGAVSYADAKVTYRTNSAVVGEVYVGATSAFVGGTIHSWKGATLEGVNFLAGTPCRVQFAYRHGSGDSSAHGSVEIPVPAGKEAEAQALVENFYAAS